MKPISRALILCAGVIALTGAQLASAQSSYEYYLRSALEILKTSHINRDKVDWPKLTREAEALAANAVDPGDTYPAIEYVINELGEAHTSLIPARNPERSHAQSTVNSQKIIIPEPAGEMIDGRFGLVKIPSFMSPRNSSYSHDFLIKTRAILASHDAQGVCGWIIDLRGNGGGNIWPMADGLLPLMGESPYWRVETTTSSVVGERNGRLHQEGAPEAFPLPPLLLRRANAPVALLIDQRTKSSAEGLAIAFKGRPGVRYFGETTGDLVTINNSRQLADGATLVVTVGYSRDRTGKLWTGPIEPDEPTTSEAALGAAVQWLSQQSCG